MPKPKINAVNIQRSVYTMASVDGKSAEITMYGDIYEKQPTDWWGDPIEGQYILLSDFLSDLNQIENCTDITIRMNSYGGDAVVSNLIHNRLRELSANGTHLTCVVDGVAMSGGSLIMCACDTVRVNPSSLIMIHKCWGFIWGGYNADELRDMANAYDAYDKMQVAIYQRKTNLSETKILHMMGETTYMTGKEAVEKGFADELIEDAEPLDIAASANGRALICNGRTMHLCTGMMTPDFIPKVKTEPVNPSVKTNTNQPAQSGNHEEGGTHMATTVEELRVESPELVNQVETAASAAAVKAEQNRIREIDEVASLFDEDLVQAAKYGDTACSAQELAYRAAKKAAGQGRAFLAQMEEDANASGTGNVGAAPAPSADDGAETPESIRAAAKADAAAYNKSTKEVR